MKKYTLHRIVLVLAVIAVVGLGFFSLVHSEHSSFESGIRRVMDLNEKAGPTIALSSFSAPVLAWIAFVMLVGGFAHGMIGFGFPIIATPLLTLVLPMKQTILVLLVPTLVMTILNALRGGRLRESIGRYWYLPLLSGDRGFRGNAAPHRCAQ